jgi:hypothetical protein
MAVDVDVLPETAAVHWRRRVDAAQLRLRGRLWTLTMVAHVVPFAGAATLLMWLQPLALPVALVCLAHAWIIPELYAQRGANVLRPPVRGAGAGPAQSASGPEPEQRSVGLLGDLVGHDARALHARTGLVLEPGRLGTWIVGESGAVLLHGGRRPRAFCYCVKVDPRRPAARDLPSGDRIAHLLLALRGDEQGFATVANLAFAGATWRLRRRMSKPTRPALKAALAASDSRSSGAGANIGQRSSAPPARGPQHDGHA